MIKLPLIAAIDVGTNSFHLAICSVNNRGMMNTVLRERETVRLGSGSGDMKMLTPDAIERGISTLIHFNELAKSKDARIVAVATSAVREALNRDEFLSRIKDATGIDIEVVSGLEEARLIYNGAVHALPILTRKTLVIDIGGGSTETTVGLNGEIIYSHSAKLGAIRLTQRFNLDKYPVKASIEKCREFIRGEWAPIMKRINNCNFDIAVGTSGTITNIVMMAYLLTKGTIPEIVNGISVKSQYILRIIKKLTQAKNMKALQEIPGLDTGRADIILGGALILEQAILALGIEEIHLSSYALREGIVFNEYQKQHDTEKYQHLNHLRYQSIYNLATEYRVNLVHAEHVKATALTLFDSLKSLHNYSRKERELLEAAAILHDVGYHISLEQHHRHSYYIISNCMMPGFTKDEAEVIANIARYHRKSHPKRIHENFAVLTKSRQDLVRMLASFLRIGEGIDRRQLQIVQGIRIEIKQDEILIYVKAENGDNYPDIEVWGANRRKLLMEEVFGKKVTVMHES